MRNMLLGILLSATVFGVLSWATTKRTVHAEVLTTPPAGRYQVVHLRAQSGTELSGILDTETGCTWAFVPSVGKQEPNGGSEHAKQLFAGEHAYLMLLGGGLGFFGAVNYDVQGYLNLFKPTQGSKSVGMSIPAAMREVGRVDSACERARLQALDAAGGH